MKRNEELHPKTGVKPATKQPCKDCPWRTTNQGKRHKDGWFTKANRARLWSKLRRGESMTCHMTDPTNPVPEGYKTVPETATTHECAGALILQQREFMKFQNECGGDLKDYRKRWPRGLTREGIMEIVNRHLYGGVPMMGYKPMSTPNLNEPVSHTEAVGEWEPKSHGD
jgi:hypothetical protein